MKKDDIRLLAQARAGSESARIALGRRYLIGDQDIHRNVPTGVDYLLTPSPTPATLRVLVESLDLNELISRGLLPHLETASGLRVGAALVKSAIWQLLTGQPISHARQLLEHATVVPGDDGSQLLRALDLAGESAGSTDLAAAALRTAQRLGLVRALDACVEAARMHWQSGSRGSFALCVRLAAMFDPDDSDEVRALVAKLVEVASGDVLAIDGMPSMLLLTHLERRTAASDPQACYVLGLALCGMNYGQLTPRRLGVKPSSRRGAALLLRAAHHGVNAAWLDLHYAHSGTNRSVASAEMARFCLEKAAEHGIRDAQRKLGALLLRDASGLKESEAALDWLHKAHLQGDSLAATLLRSLIAPVAGNEVDAQRSIHAIAKRDPLLASRLQLARALGLTMHEALNVDPQSCMRPWGLVVEANAQSRKRRIASGRAVPVLEEHAMAQVRATVALFASHAGWSQSPAEGDFRKRYFRLRYFLKLVGARSELFFASLTAADRESLSGGRSWAARVRADLKLALRTGPSSVSPDRVLSASSSYTRVEALAA